MAVSTNVELNVLEGARNLVRYVHIEAGQEVLIHVEPQFDDPEVVGALQQAIEEVGAPVTVMRTRHWNKQTEPPPPAFEHAIEGTDVLIGQGEYLHTKNRYIQIALFERGLIYINNEAKTADALGSEYGRFPAELLFGIGQRIMARLARARQVKVTTPAGTDVTMSVDRRTVGGYCYDFRHDTPGFKKGFPGGVACFHPEDPVDGVIAIETIPPGLGAPVVLLEKPLMLTLRDHRVAAMEGPGADWLRERWATRGDGNSGWLAECMWGIHPRAMGKGGRGAANPHLLHFGFGNAIAYGGRAFSKTWTVMFTQDATLTADGEPILERGHLTLLDDRDIRTIASRYGDPGRWLGLLPATLAECFGEGGTDA